jgi:hypothetical protein
MTFSSLKWNSTNYFALFVKENATYSFNKLHVNSREEIGLLSSIFLCELFCLKRKINWPMFPLQILEVFLLTFRPSDYKNIPCVVNKNSLFSWYGWKVTLYYSLLISGVSYFTIFLHIQTMTCLLQEDFDVHVLSIHPSMLCPISLIKCLREKNHFMISHDLYWFTRIPNDKNP